MSAPKIVVLAGSTRAGSFNATLARIAAESARAAGAEVTEVELRALALPLYDADLEAERGLPEGAKTLKARLRDSDGFLLASPEYNSSVTPALKNAIDWASRAESDDEPPLVAYRGKTAALVAASPGALGGLRGLVTLRSILGNIGVHVMPDQVCIPTAHEAFDDRGQLRDARKKDALDAFVRHFVAFTKKHRA